MGFSAFVLDHGVMMLARGQAQNVADAAALSGIITRVADEPGPADPAVNGITEKVITHAVNQGTIFGGASADIGRTWDWACPPGLPTGAWCVRANVFRDGDIANGSTPLPVYFAPLFGLSSQKTRATATAAAWSANGTRCLKPWVIPDKWQEASPAVPGNATDEFNPALGDTYTPGNGYTLADIGTTVLLKPGNPNQAISSSFYFAIDCDPDANGECVSSSNSGAVYEENIANCRITKRIGDTINTNPGNMTGPTRQGVTRLTVDGPRDVVIAMFSPAQFVDVVNPHGNFDLTIVNMMSVRVSGMQGNDVIGVITGGIGEDLGPGPTPTGTSSMIYTIKLVR
jgi:hypothetical protein